MEPMAPPVSDNESFLHDLKKSIRFIQSADWDLVNGTTNPELEHMMVLLRYKYEPHEVQTRSLTYSMYSPNRIEDGGEVFTINGEIDTSISSGPRKTHLQIYKMGRDEHGEFKENMYFAFTFNPVASELKVIKTHRNFSDKREGEWTWKIK